ncbi:MAG: hypothetical protein RJA49_1982, partial [Actinomycetota bacterium]
MAAWYDGAAVTVEIEFSTGVWSDVTTYVLDITGSRGRAYERDSFVPGTLNLTLANPDRRFDPDHTSSPYAPSVIPMRQVRVTWTYAATPYRLYTGWIQGWPQSWDDPADKWSTVSVVALDALSILAMMSLPPDVYYTTVLADTPTAYYRLGEANGSPLAMDSSGSGNHATYIASSQTASLGPSLTSFSTDGSRTIARTSFGMTGGVATGFKAPTGTAWSVEMWVTFPTTVGNSVGYTILGATGGVGGMGFRLDGNAVKPDTFGVSVTDGTTNTTAVYNATTQLLTGSRHHLVVTHTTTSSILYIDGAVATPTSGSLGAIAGSTFGDSLLIDIFGD